MNWFVSHTPANSVAKYSKLYYILNDIISKTILYYTISIKIISWATFYPSMHCGDLPFLKTGKASTIWHNYQPNNSTNSIFQFWKIIPCKLYRNRKNQVSKSTTKGLIIMTTVDNEHYRKLYRFYSVQCMFTHVLHVLWLRLT